MFNKTPTPNKTIPSHLDRDNRGTGYGETKTATPVSPADTQRALANMLPAQPAPAATAASEKESLEAGSSTSRLIVGPKVRLKGAEIHDCDTLVVEGRVEATMDSRVLRIAQHGAFAGKVSIDVAEIHGHFEGELIVREQLIVHATGKVSGHIRYGKMLVEEGGELSGDIRSLAAEDSQRTTLRPAGTALPPKVELARALTTGDSPLLNGTSA